MSKITSQKEIMQTFERTNFFIETIYPSITSSSEKTYAAYVDYLINEINRLNKEHSNDVGLVYYILDWVLNHPETAKSLLGDHHD